MRSLLRGFARLNPHWVKHADAITPKIMLDIYSVMDIDDPLVLACCAAFLLAFFLMARKANLVPSGLRSFDARKHLTRGNIVFVPSGLIVNMGWSKTNQFGARLLKVPVPHLPNSPLCPVTAYKRLVCSSW